MKFGFCLAMALVVSVNARADITGEVTLDGKAPTPREIDMSGIKGCEEAHADPITEETVVADEKGNLANVVVSIKPDPAQPLAGEALKGQVMLDQKGCQYVPHVVAMQAGQELIAKNSDAFLHNVHSLSDTNGRFNKEQATQNNGEKMDPQPAQPEYFKVKCDIHPWMSAWVAVFNHPYFAVTKADGTFTIKTAGLKDGDYTLLFWHEKLASTPVEQKVMVKDGKASAYEVLKQE